MQVEKEMAPSNKISETQFPDLYTNECPVGCNDCTERPSATTINTSASLLPDEVTSITKSNKRPSKIQLAATLRKIRLLLAEGYTNKEIIEMLQLEERTFYRYMRRIYAQDKAYFEKQDNESIATEIMVAKERTLKSLRRFDAIAADESLSAEERMEAERFRGDIVIALVKIEIEGPRIVHDTSRRLYDRQYKRSSKLHPREVMLIRRLLVLGWSDHRIWKEYRIPLPIIKKAKKEIPGRAVEEFEDSSTFLHQFN